MSTDNTRRHGKKFSHLGKLVPEISAPLLWVLFGENITFFLRVDHWSLISLRGRDLSLHCHILAGCGARSAFSFICVVKKPEVKADRLPPDSGEVKAI